MSVNSIKIGNVTITHEHIVSGTLSAAHAMMGETLAADSLTFTIDTGIGTEGLAEGFVPADEETPLLDADGNFFYTEPDESIFSTVDVSGFAPGDDVFLYVDGKLTGKYTLKSIKRIGRYRYTLNALSAVGQLIDGRHYGGVYEQVAVGEVLDDILEGVPHTVYDAVLVATVTGYLPIASRRDNLQQVLFATGSAVFTGDDGTLEIRPMPGGVSSTLTAGQIYTGGKVEVGSVIEAVEITEHNYFPSNEETKTIFEDAVDGTTFLEFSEPYYDLSCIGGMVISSGANFCEISANGIVTLTGKPYTHITRPVRAGDGTGNVKTITNATLANPQIAHTLAERLYAFLQNNETIVQDVQFRTGRAGYTVSVINPYTRTVKKATVTDMDVSLSGINKATCKFLVDFTPFGIVTGYTHYTVLTGKGTWKAPANVGTTVRAIIVGAGGGGGGGGAGKSGEGFSNGDESYRSRASASSSEPYVGGKGGKGGKAGEKGKGGKIYEVTISVTAGDTFSYACGAAGAAGTGGAWAYTEQGEYKQNEPEEGGSGSETVFGTRSSALGKEYPAGYYEARTGWTLGADGAEGNDGGDGGQGGAYPESGTAIYGESGTKGSDNNYAGGSGGKGLQIRELEYSPRDYLYLRAGGGGGGGGADGHAGYPGDTVTEEWIDTFRPNYVVGGGGGDGGHGKNGRDGAYYGCGGDGGSGGGGGGGGGASFRGSAGEHSTGIAIAGNPGMGGDGGNGGNGRDGVIIIYY